MALLDATRLRDRIKAALDAAFGGGSAGLSTARTSFSAALATPLIGELSAGFRVTSVWNGAAGALPLAATFTTDGGTVVLLVAGSMWTTAVGATAAMNVLVDGAVRATLRRYCNEANSHKTLVPAVCVVSGLAAGTHTLQLTVASGTSDTNDFFTAAVLELPV
jgi:hypothetical protein